ncbi:MAG: YlmC/YmxH family sporulation protein [Bacilli bacterium]|nr:YlmC/YmxH family sporulation protein [Bacilli bacterium]
MRLSELQLKEIVNICNGKRIGVIVDVLVEENGNIQKLVLEERKGRRFSKEEYVIDWNQIVKIGDDIILIDTRNK